MSNRNPPKSMDEALREDIFNRGPLSGDTFNRPMVMNTDEIRRRRADGTLETVVGTIMRRACQEALTDDTLELACRDDEYFQTIVLRMAQNLVAFEFPDEETTNFTNEPTRSVWVPSTWWDHWKQDHPRLSRLLGLRGPTFREITTNHSTSTTIKRFRLYPFVRS